jgi:hypothetical protein
MVLDCLSDTRYEMRGHAPGGLVKSKREGVKNRYGACLRTHGHYLHAPLSAAGSYSNTTAYDQKMTTYTCTQKCTHLPALDVFCFAEAEAF